jgi:hypothetical protein
MVIDHMKSNSSGWDRDLTVASVASNVKSGGRNRFTLEKGQSTVDNMSNQTWRS